MIMIAWSLTTMSYITGLKFLNLAQQDDTVNTLSTWWWLAHGCDWDFSWRVSWSIFLWPWYELPWSHRDPQPTVSCKTKRLHLQPLLYGYKQKSWIWIDLLKEAYSFSTYSKFLRWKVNRDMFLENEQKCSIWIKLKEVYSFSTFSEFLR